MDNAANEYQIVCVMLCTIHRLQTEHLKDSESVVIVLFLYLRILTSYSTKFLDWSKKKKFDWTNKTLLCFVNVMEVMQQQENEQQTVHEQTKHYEIWGNQSDAESRRLLACDAMYLPKQLLYQATGSVSNQPRFQTVHQIGSANTPTLLLNGYSSAFLGVRWPENESDRSSRSNAEVMNEWNYIYTPPICFHGGHRDRFTFKVRSGEVRSGEVRSGQVRSGQVRSGQVRSGQVRWGEVRWGEVRWGEVRWGEVRWGEVRLG